MKERLTYVLFVMLLAIAWNTDDLAPLRTRGAAARYVAVSIAPSSPASEQARLTAETVMCSLSMETPATSSFHKDLYRLKSDTRSCPSDIVRPRGTVCTAAGFTRSRTVDYYVFSLGRILI